MTTALALPTGSYQNRDLRSSSKKLVGCMSELMAQTAPADSKSAVPPITIRRAPGIGIFASETYSTTIMLLHYDGTLGSTSFPDAAGNFTFTATDIGVDTAAPRFGTGCLTSTATVTQQQYISAPLTVGSVGDVLSAGHESDFTFEGWFRLDNTESITVLDYGTSDYTDPGIVVGFDTVTASIILPNGVVWPGLNTAISASTGVWYHWALVRQTGNATLYFNGVSTGPSSPWTGPVVFGSSPQIRILDSLATVGGTGGGSVDETRISNVAIYTANFTPPTAPFTISGASAVTSLAVRGINKMQGVVYAVIGATLYTVADDGTATAIATGILGEGFVRMTNNTACLVILVPNTNICYTYSLVGGFQLLTAPGFTDYGAIDCNFCDSFIVFLALNGREFFNDDGQIVSGQGQITFNSGSVFPREFGTDLFVGMAVDHREVLLLGQLTSEGYLNAGNAVGTPFDSAPDSFIQLGALPGTAYCIANQDQSVFWVANDKTVRRRNGQTPQRVSNSGIEAVLEHADFTGSYALTPSVGGHATWALILPAESRTLCYDCLTTEWFELDSVGFGYWRPLCYYNAFGKQLVGDSVSSQIGFLDTSIYTEFGTPMLQQFVTQSIYDNNNRITHRRLEVVITVGEAPDLGTEPLITLFVSRDSGRTWRARETKPMGFAGDREVRVFWTNLGQARNQTYMFQISDPTPSYTVAIVAELDGGKW